MFFHLKQLEDESRSVAKQLMADVQEKHRRETSKIGRLLSLYVDDSVPAPTTFGEVPPPCLENHAAGGTENHRSAHECKICQQTGATVAGSG